MSMTFANDIVTVEHLIHEITRPVGQRRASASQFAHSINGRENRRDAPRVNLVSSDVEVQLGEEFVSAVDFSLRGMQFRSLTRVVPGSTVIVSVKWKQQTPSVALGRVMWATFEKLNHLAAPHYRVGLIFETADVRTLRMMLEECGLGRGANAELEVVNHR